MEATHSREDGSVAEVIQSRQLLLAGFANGRGQGGSGGHEVIPLSHWVSVLTVQSWSAVGEHEFFSQASRACSNSPWEAFPTA